MKNQIITLVIILYISLASVERSTKWNIRIGNAQNVKIMNLTKARLPQQVEVLPNFSIFRTKNLLLWLARVAGTPKSIKQIQVLWEMFWTSSEIDKWRVMPCTRTVIPYASVGDGRRSTYYILRLNEYNNFIRTWLMLPILAHKTWSFPPKVS